MARSAPSAVSGLAAALPVPTALCLTGTWAPMRHNDFSVKKGSSWKGTLAKVGGGPQDGRTRDSSYKETGTEVRGSWAKCPWVGHGKKGLRQRFSGVDWWQNHLEHLFTMQNYVLPQTWSGSPRGGAWLTAVCTCARRAGAQPPPLDSWVAVARSPLCAWASLSTQ